MTLSYSTKYPAKMQDFAGKPTYFPEKILKGLIEEINKKKTLNYEIAEFMYDYGKSYGYEYIDDVLIKIEDSTPKITTIREDKKDRWKVGNKIHFVINNRTKDRFQFAPVVEVKAVQEIEIIWLKNTAWVYIDDNEFSTFTKTKTGFEYGKKLEFLCLNDGFESVNQFFQWFDKDFVGKLIHWTDLKY